MHFSLDSISRLWMKDIFMDEKSKNKTYKNKLGTF
jgi:hypothetical protein